VANAPKMHRKGAVGFIVSIRSCPRRETFGVTLYFSALFPKLGPARPALREIAWLLRALRRGESQSASPSSSKRRAGRNERAQCSARRRVFDRTGIKTKAVKRRLALTIFLNKSANFFLQRPYLLLEQRITRGCFPSWSGTGSCAAPLLSAEIRHVQPPLLAA
jgi:hypothetical protein